MPPLPKENPNKTYLNFRNNLYMLYKNLPQEDLAFIQKGLSQEAWQRILNALGGV